LIESALTLIESVLMRTLSGPESVFGFAGIGTTLMGGVGTCARAGKAAAYKSAPATRPRRAGVRKGPEALFSELSRE
jgi:hypothetical protein